MLASKPAELLVTPPAFPDLLFAGACRLSILNKHLKKSKIADFLQICPFRGTLGSGLEVNFAKARQVKQGMMQELLEDLPNKISTSSC
ncbi:MAG: hypothetical protein ACK6D6_18385 [Planctomyces sp.]